jgi:hypothetical protein
VLADDRTPDRGLDTAQSHVLYVTRSAKVAEAVRSLPFHAELAATAIRPWTDDYSDILSAMWRKRH